MKQRNSLVEVLLFVLMLAGSYRLLRELGGIPSPQDMRLGHPVATRSNIQATMTAWGPASRRTPPTPMARPTRNRRQRTWQSGAGSRAPYPAPGQTPSLAAESETQPRITPDSRQATAVVEAGIFGKQLKRTASDAYYRSYFGNAVAIHGNRAIIGAYRDGEQAASAGAA